MPERSAFPLDVLEFNLDERRTFLQDHDEEMEYICACLSHYYEDVKHAIDYGLSHSVVSHFTYNLVLVLAKGLTSLTIYEYMHGAYLLEEDFDNVYKSWKSVHDSAEEIIPLLVNLEKENYFDEDIEMEDFMMDILPPYCDKAKGFEKLLNLHRRIALSTGGSLITTLSCYIRNMEQWLADLKSGLYKAIEEDYDRVYWANYNLYKKEYWPIDGHDFRLNVQNDNFFSAEITPDFLARCLWEEKRNFEQTPTGQLRRDFINNKKELYFEVKRISLTEEQWRYFFKSICRFEEYQKWIEELKNPLFRQEGESSNTPTGMDSVSDVSKIIITLFSEDILNVEEPSQLYFLLLAMWARRLLQNKEIPAFVRMVGAVYPSLFNRERTQERVVMSLQNMNNKANKYFDVFVKDQATMIGYIEMMYPKTKNGSRRKECERAVNLATQLFLKLK